MSSRLRVSGSPLTHRSVRARSSPLPVIRAEGGESVTATLVGPPDSALLSTVSPRRTTPMNFRNRPARVAAATGAVVVAGAATMLAVAAGTASADEPGRCLQNVNIREEPDAQSRIVALCEAGTQGPARRRARRLGPHRRAGRLGVQGLRQARRVERAQRQLERGPLQRRGRGHSSRDGDGSGSSGQRLARSGSPRAARTRAARTASGSHDSGSHESDSGDGEHSRGAGERRATPTSTACWADRQTTERTRPASAGRSPDDADRVRRGGPAARRPRPRRATPAAPSTPSAARPHCRPRRAASRRCRGPRTPGRHRRR